MSDRTAKRAVIITFDVGYISFLDGFYAVLGPHTGYQSYARYGVKNSDTFFGDYGSAGWAMKTCTSFEVYSEGGNYAGGTVAGYNYYQTGFKLIAYF